MSSNLEKLLTTFDKNHTSGIYLNPYLICAGLSTVLKYIDVETLLYDTSKPILLPKLRISTVKSSVLRPVQVLTYLINDIEQDRNIEFMGIRDTLVKSRLSIVNGNVYTAKMNIIKIIFQYKGSLNSVLMKQYIHGKWMILKCASRLLSLHSQAVITANHPSRIDFTIKGDA